MKNVSDGSVRLPDPYCNAYCQLLSRCKAKLRAVKTLWISSSSTSTKDPQQLELLGLSKMTSHRNRERATSVRNDKTILLNEMLTWKAMNEIDLFDAWDANVGFDTRAADQDNANKHFYMFHII